MRPKFLADADFNEDILKGLRRHEPALDFLTASEAGTRGVPDTRVLEIAAGAGRILLTHDRRTMLAHFDQFTQNQQSPGLFITPQRDRMADVIADLIMVWAASEAAEWTNVRNFLPL